MTRVNNNRPIPGPSRGPGASSTSAPLGGRQGVSTLAVPLSGAAVMSGNVPSVAASYPVRPTQSVITPSISSSQGVDSRQPTGVARVTAPQLQTEVVISPNNRQSSAELSGSSVIMVADAQSRENVQSFNSRPHSSGGSAQMRPPQSSSSASSTVGQHHHHPQQQHRTHPPGIARPTSQVTTPTGNRPSLKLPQPPGSANPQGTRPLPSQQSGPHPSSHQTLPRPAHDHTRPQQDPLYSHDQSHLHSDAMKLPHDLSRHEPVRPDAPRHGRTDRRSDTGIDTRRAMPQSELNSSRSQSLRPELSASQRPSELSPRTPPSSPPPVKSLSPLDSALGTSQFLPSSGDASDTGINTNSSSPENFSKSQSILEAQKQRSLANQGPKLSLTMYRERTSAKSRTPADQNTSGDDVNTSVTDEAFALGQNAESITDSPVGVGLRQSTSHLDLVNFSKPQDSPSNPRIKIKVKRDPSSGERHAVKYADSGLRIKIKPIRSETSGAADGDAGPSGHDLSSCSSTPREEGEIIEDTPPSSGDSEQKAERLKIRLSVPKSDHTSAYSRRESDQGSNGHSGERESGHRSHHHGHHRSHHHSKSKKHSKHDRSRYEGKSSSKRSASTTDYYEERPSKSSRSDTYSGEVSHRLAGYSEISSGNSSSRILQQQTSGFSINDAFSSTMPHNIFNDDDDDPGHIHPPITPTADSMPPHHEKFHQLMAQHRAKLEATTMKPPLPKGPPPPHSSPPPPPPTPPAL